MKYINKVYIIGFIVAFTTLYFLYTVQVYEYGNIHEIDISTIKDMTSEFMFNVDDPIDSDYIVLSGYAYQTHEEYKTIDYKIVLLNKRTGEAFYVKTQPVERNDLVEKDEKLAFSKVGLYGRVSKGAGAFSENYYEICYLITINNGTPCIIHTGYHMGTPEEQ